MEPFGQTPDQWLDFIWSSNNGFFRPIQNYQEISSLINIVNERKPKAVLEIGTANGGSLFLFCRAADSDAQIVSIDLPGGINGGGYPKWKERLYQLFTKEGQTLHLLRKNSHLQSTKDYLKSLGLRAFDLIMIDADHSYNGVKTDFELYQDLLSENGIIVLHDVIKNEFDPSVQVDRFWKQVKSQYETQEIIDNVEQGNMGIGIVFKT